jgi:hypothetical protein
MVALLKTKIPRETREARIELEQIVRESPKHLNALADLEPPVPVGLSIISLLTLNEITKQKSFRLCT